VVGVDKDLGKLELLQKGKSPIHEPGLEELMHQASSNLKFTSDTPEAVAEWPDI